jgi:hypothetical protein
MSGGLSGTGTGFIPSTPVFPVSSGADCLRVLTFREISMTTVHVKSVASSRTAGRQARNSTALQYIQRYTCLSNIRAVIGV